MIDAITLELLHEDARAPERATEGSAGYDLFAYLTGRTVSYSDGSGVKDAISPKDLKTGAGCFVIQPGVTARIPLGFKAKLPKGFEAQIRPRSGTAFKKGLTVPNAPGTVDSDYPDEWMVLIRNETSIPVQVEHGERIAQMVLGRFEILPFERGTVQRSTTRAGGFGSTGR